MSIHHRAVFDSTTAARLSHFDSDAAELIVWQIEDLSRSPSEDCRADLQHGRGLLDRLRVACGGQPALRPIFQRGKRAAQLLLDRHHEAIHVEKAKRDRILSARAAAVVERNAHYFHVASQKERIIAILETAARTTDPAAFAPHIRQCKQIWLGLGIAGRDNVRLAYAYRDAAAAYWNSVKSAADQAALTDEPIDRRTRLLNALATSWRTTRETVLRRWAQQLRT